MDHSGLEAIHELADQYEKIGKTVYLRGLSKDTVQLLAKVYNADGSGNEVPSYEVLESDSSNGPGAKLYTNVGL